MIKEIYAVQEIGMCTAHSLANERWADRVREAERWKEGGRG